MIVLRWLCFVIATTCICHGTAGAQRVDFVIANFSNAMLQLFEVQNGRGELIRNLESGHPHGHRGAAGSVWRINWLLGPEVCRFTVRERMTIVTVDAPAVPAGWRKETIAGFQVLFSPALLRDEASSVRVRQIMHDRLDDVARLVPPAALQHLRRVRLWLNVDPSGFSGAFYATWPSNLHDERARGYGEVHGAMYQSAVFPSIIQLIEITDSLKAPMVVLHELAHAYHHQVIGSENIEIKQTYEAAKAKGLYRNVSYPNGAVVPVGYAMSNEWEYFAVLTETYFGRNHHAPFDAGELKSYDPDGFRLIERAWSGALDSIVPIKTVACRSPARPGNLRARSR
jgi:hypothetical protein